jgi:hypothetical protein
MKTRSTRSKPVLPLVALATFVLGATAVIGCTAPEQPAPLAQPAAAPQQVAAPIPKSRPSPASQQVRADIAVIHMALDAFAANNGGTYPDSLKKLVLQDMNGYRYLNQTSIPRDPWDREYRYVDGPPPIVTTFGADGKPGGSGDDADIDSSSVNGR